MIDYHFANPSKFVYLIPESGLNMYIKQANKKDNISFRVNCEVTGVEEKSPGKYILKLYNTDTEFDTFITHLEKCIQMYAKKCKGFNQFKSNKKANYFETKIKYRYSKFEVKCYKDEFLYPVNEMKNCKARVLLELSNVWKMNEYYGILWIVKEIKIA